MNSRLTFHFGSDQDKIRARRESLKKEKFTERLRQKDPLLWSTQADTQNLIRNSLGWLDVQPQMQKAWREELIPFARAVIQSELKFMVCLGMGGSSLSAWVFSEAFQPRQGLKLLALDTSDPDMIADLERQIDLRKTLFVVASKSGTTIESALLHQYFYHQLKALVGNKAGSHFIAITDPGTPLAVLAQEQGFRRVFLNPKDIGGRFSALTYFGLVPAALMGIDLEDLLQRALSFEIEESLDLGAALAEMTAGGRDKMTLVASPRLKSIARWVEQLTAESSGKNGIGILPIEGEPGNLEGTYGNDRFFVFLSLRGEEMPKLQRIQQKIKDQGHPWIEIELSDISDLGAELLRWETAIACAGHILKFNPFDQPNVQESKSNTANLLKQKSTLTVADGLAPLVDFLRGFRTGDYVALMPFLAETPSTHQILQNIRSLLLERLGAPTTLGFGPRFLHSTGQLHKGGPDSFMGVQFTCDYDRDLAIPGEPFSFGDLIHAQALGDLQALKRNRKRVFHLHLGKTPEAFLRDIETSLKKSL